MAPPVRVGKRIAVGLLGIGLAHAAVGLPGAAAAAPRAAGAVPAAWTTRVCTQVVGIQAAALDARDGFWSATARPPSDRTEARTTAQSLRASLATVSDRLDTLDRTLRKAAPSGRQGMAARDALRAGLARVGDTYAETRARAARLAKAPPERVASDTAQLLGRLDRSLEQASRGLARTEATVRASSVGPEFARQAACRAVGFEWAMLAGTEPATPAPDPTAVTSVPGAADLTAPDLLLPGRYRPTPTIAGLAAETAMTGLGRTHFYGGLPSVETGATFATDCPTTQDPGAQILGCFHDGRIFILAVSRPEVARIVAVTAAHEMLHAVYDTLPDVERATADAMTSSFYGATTDARLRRSVANYDERAPENRANELHSLVPTQVPTLTPELDAYYAAYFRDRALVVAAYQSYVGVFEGLLARSDALKVAIGDLRTRIDALRAQSDAATREANQLALQIDALRVQGRLAEANALVAGQNDAVRRAQGLNAEGNRLVGDFNALVDELNAIVREAGGLQSALRPLG
jgi:hypothetical protein